MVFDVALHTGIEHPNLLWIFIPALVTFVMGIGVGTFTARRNSEASSQADPADQ